MSPLFGMFGMGYWEILIIGGIILLLFGHRLPTMMRSLGRGVVEFKKGVQGIEDELDQAGTKSSQDESDKPEKSEE